MENALITLREKYADDLEEILQCPVCFERLSGIVPLCERGHHVCHRCQPLMDNCPVCKHIFNGSRNFLAEGLMSKFEEIRSSLIDPKHPSNQRVLENRICIATQTESVSTETNNNNDSGINIEDVTNNSKENKEAMEKPPVTGKGKYPCRIGQCEEELPHGRMIPHIRYYHKDQLIEEKIAHNGIYTNSWKVYYNVPEQFDRAIHIQNMGLFFLNINIDDEGILSGKLQIVNTCLIADQFKYVLEISSYHTSMSYKGKVMGCRSKHKSESSLLMDSSVLKYMMKTNKQFACKLTLTRVLDTELSVKKNGSRTKLMNKTT